MDGQGKKLTVVTGLRTPQNTTTDTNRNTDIFTIEKAFGSQPDLHTSISSFKMGTANNSWSKSWTTEDAHVE